MSSTYYPYRTEAARDACFAYIDSLAAKWPVPAEERMVPTSFGPTCVRISGPADAPPLLLLPGATAMSLMWAPNVAGLSRERRVYCVDQMNEFGKSVCEKPIGSMGDLTCWLDELFAALELGPDLALGGVSYGGALSLQYALRFPGRLGHLVLLAPGATIAMPGVGFWARLAVGMCSKRIGMGPFLRWIFATMQSRDPQWVATTVEQLELNLRSVQRHRMPMPPVLKDAEWARLQTPTLFLVGEREVIYSAEMAVRHLKRVAPAVRTAIVPGAGHDFTVAEADAVNRLILDFLREDVDLRAASGRCVTDSAARK